jgi:hypothetical protein
VENKWVLVVKMRDTNICRIKFYGNFKGNQYKSEPSLKREVVQDDFWTYLEEIKIIIIPE